MEAAGQVTSMKYARDTTGSQYYTETRSYNVLGQMTRQRAQDTYGMGSVRLDRTYTFSSTQNDGRITQMADAVSGETVQYQYDSLKRLISASTTGLQWGQSFGYDAFGNLLNQVVTKGSAPSMSRSVNPITNRLYNHGYDVNGNLTSMPNLTLAYDLENRLVQTVHSVNGTERYVYDPANQRVWKQEPSRTLVYFYGVEGNLLATYGDGVNTDYNFYFGAKLVWAEASPGIAAGPVTLDRLGSAVRHFPYGSEPTDTGQDRVKFATYYRDSTSTLDYARNRYYARTIGRFTTPDPYRPSGGPADPQSWNRYSYVQNDPVNYYDPAGAEAVPAGDAVCPVGAGEGLQYVACFIDVVPVGNFPSTSVVWMQTFLALQDKLQAQLAEAWRTLDKGCQEALSAHFNLSKVAASSADIVFYDTRDNRTAAFHTYDVSGDRDLAFPTLGQSVEGAVATVLWGRDDKISNKVALNGTFFTLTYTEQNLTLVHEALHVVSGMGDQALAEELGLGRYDRTVAGGHAASESIANWLTYGCKPVSSI